MQPTTRVRQLCARIDEISAEINDLSRKISTQIGVMETKEAQLSEYIDAYCHLLPAFNDLHTARTEVSKLVERMKKGVLPDRFEEAGLSTVTTDDYRVTISKRFVASTVSDRKQDAINWLIDNGYEGMVNPTISASSLGSLQTKLLKEEGLSLPEDLFRVEPMRTASITAVKKART